MDWPDVTTALLTATTDRLQVTSINTPVTFSAASPADMTVVAWVNGSTSDTGATTTSLGSSLTPFTVPPNAFVWFVASAVIPTGGTVTVRNTTAGSAIVDAFTITLGSEPPP